MLTTQLNQLFTNTFRWNFTSSSVRLTGEFHTPSDVAEISRLLLPRSSDETMFFLAEQVGFEPTGPSLTHPLSRRAP